MPNMVEIIQNVAVKAMQESAPAAIMFGTVVSTSPLTVNVEQRLTLDADMLILSTLVSDFDVDMTVDHSTEPAEGGAAMGAFDSHSHGYRGRKTFRVHLGLSPGEKIILQRVQGGQKFIILDRVRGGAE